MLLQKITTGFVIQTFDTDKQDWVKQEFIASDECEYEIDGNPINSADFENRVIDNNVYLPYTMVQP